MRASDVIRRDVESLRDNAPRLSLGQNEVFIRNMVFLYQVINASENLMEIAARESSGALRQYFWSHLEEERDHAKWLEDDLNAIKVDVCSKPLIRGAVELAGSQYYFIHHVSPACLLGYMAVLEGFPFPLDTLVTLEGIHGRSPLRCLRYHAENDLEHRKELFKIIDQVDDPLVYQNAIRTQYVLNEVTKELC